MPKKKQTNEVNLDLQRKFLHLFGGTVFVAILLFVELELAKLLSLALLVATFFISMWIKSDVRVPIFYNLAESLGRSNERLPGESVLQFFLATTVLFFVFNDKVLALSGVAATVFGDGAAAIFGKLLGKTKIYKSKTLEGTLSMLVAAFAALYFFQPLQIAFVAAFLATLTEVFLPDDNLSIPIVVATSIFLLKSLPFSM